MIHFKRKLQDYPRTMKSSLWIKLLIEILSLQFILNVKLILACGLKTLWSFIFIVMKYFYFLYKPLCMVCIIHHISFCIENEYNVFDIHANRVDNLKHTVLYKPRHKKKYSRLILFLL